jgi:hypothetical protein
MIELHALLGQGINVGGMDLLITVTAQHIKGLLVCEHK